MMIRTILIVALIGLFGTNAAARSVAVAPPQYVDLASGEKVDEAAEKVEEQVLEGVAEAGYDVITGDDVAAAILEESVEGECDDQCLQRVAAKLNVDDVIVVKIEDDEQVTYRATVSFAIREDVSDERTAGFYVVLEWLKGTIALAMKQDAKLQSPAGPEAPAETANTDTGADDAAKPVTVYTDSKKLRPLPLFIAAGTTAAFGLTTLILNGVAHKKYETTEDDIDLGTADRDDALSNIESVENLQTAVKVGLVATGVGLVATGVLALFTDFSRFKKSKSNANSKNADSQDDVALTPGVLIGPKFGAFSIGGTF